MSRRPHSPQPSSSSGGGARRRHHNNPWMNGRGRGAGTGGGGGGAAAFPEPSSSSGFAFRPGHSVNEEDDLDDPLIDSTVDSMGRPSYFQQYPMMGSSGGGGVCCSSSNNVDSSDEEFPINDEISTSGQVDRGQFRLVPNNPEDDIFNQNHDDPQEAAPLLPEIAGIVHHNGALNGAVGEEEEAEEEAEENENIQEAAVMPPPVPSAGPSPALPPKPRTLPENPISAHSEPLQLVPAAGGPIPHASTSSPLEGQGPSRNDQTPSEPKHHPLPLVPTNPGDFSLSMPPINARDRELRPTLEAQEDQRRSSETSSPSTPHDGEFQVRKSEESGKNSASAAAAAAAEIYPSLLNVDAIQPNVDDVHLEAISSHEERQDELAPFLSRNRGMKIMIHDDRSEEKKTKDEIEEEKGKEDTTSSISELMIPCLDSYREEQHEHSSTFSETNFGHPVDLEDIQLQNLLADSAAYNPEESGGGPSNHSSGHTDARFPSHCTPFPEDDPSCFLPSVHHQSINDGVGIIPPSPSPSPPPPMHRDQKSVPCDSINGEKKSFSPSSPILSPPPALTTTTSSCPNLASMTGPLSKRLRRLHSLQQKSGEVCETKENENGRLVEGVNKASIQPKLHLTISDAPVKSRAKASLPSTHLLLEEVPGKPPKIRAKLNILAGTNFGPLEGVRLCRVRFQDGIASDVFFVTSGDGQLHQIHAIDENVSNWMMFVPRARNSNDRLDSNLEAFENDGQIFFRATKDIAPEDELKYQLSVEYLEKYDLAAADFSDHNDEDNLTNGDSTSISFYSCETCPLNFNTSGVLRLHSIIHTLEEDAEDSAATVNGSVKKSCPECQMCVGTSQWHLAVHVSKYHGWKKNSNYGKSKSRKRLKLFSSTEKLKRPLFIQKDEEELLKCNQCGKVLLSKSALSSHLKSHSAGQEKFDCPLCDEIFPRVINLKNHVHNHKIGGFYTCQHCSKKFTEYPMVRKHIRAFHGDKKFNCSQCDKKFCNSSKLKQHLVTHSNLKTIPCPECRKLFGRKDKMKEHFNRMHLNVKARENISSESKNKEEEVGILPSVEKNGDDVSNNSNDIKTVDNSSYDIYVYKCHKCVLGFKRRGMLVNHLAKKHPDISPSNVPELNLPIMKASKDFFCQFCSKVYKSNSKRKSHILKKHPGLHAPDFRINANDSAMYSATVGSVSSMPYNCKCCHKQYASNAKLLQHTRKSHPQTLN